MNEYKIIFSKETNKDIQDLFDLIEQNYKAPLTAKRYILGLFSTIDLLSHSADSYPIQNHKSFLKYGLFVRRINYKKMVIIFTLENDIAFILRIIPSAILT
jgi:plasmid stabilization system protein ParE